MSLLTRMFTATERRATWRDADGWLFDWAVGGSKTTSGELVSPTNALGVSAYYGSIRAISEDVAKLPLPVIRKEGRKKTPLDQHRVKHLLNVSPNPDMGAMSWRETMGHFALGWGGGVAEIAKDGTGQPMKIGVPIHPTRVRLDRSDSGELLYIITGEAGKPEVTLPQDRVFHLHGLGVDGISGYSVAGLARETLGLSLASERSGAAFFGNQSRPSGVLETVQTMDEDARKRLRTSWEAMHGGAENSHKTALLEEGVSFKPIAIPATDAQWIESRHFGVEEIARWFRIPPHKIQHLLRSTFSNIEQQSIEYVVDCLLPWMTRWEQEISRKLIMPSEKGVFAEHNANALLRGDTVSRFNAYATARNWGWMSANDIRALENQSPIDGGDVYLSPMNMIPSEDIGKEPEVVVAQPDTTITTGDSSEPGDDAVSRMAEAHRPAFVEAYTRVLQVEADRCKGPAKRGELEEWSKGFYTTHVEHTRGRLIPTIQTFADSVWVACADQGMPDAVTEGLCTFGKQTADGHVEASLRELAETRGIVCNGRAEQEADATIASLSALMRGFLIGS